MHERCILMRVAIAGFSCLRGNAHKWHKHIASQCGTGRQQPVTPAVYGGPRFCLVLGITWLKTVSNRWASSATWRWTCRQLP